MVRNTYRKRYKRSYRRSYKGSYKKNLFNWPYKKRAQKTSSLVMTRGPLVMPDAAFVQLDWSTDIVMSSTSSTITDKIFRISSIWDPVYATGGNNPTGIDQWNAFYFRYLVHGTLVDINFVNLAAVTARCGISVRNETAAITSIATESDNQFTYSKILPASGTEGSNWSFRKYFSTKKIHGRQQLTYSEFGAAIKGTIPSINTYLHVFNGNPLDSNNTGVIARLKLRFFVELFERKTFKQGTLDTTEQLQEQGQDEDA